MKKTTKSRGKKPRSIMKVMNKYLTKYFKRSKQIFNTSVSNLLIITLVISSLVFLGYSIHTVLAAAPTCNGLAATIYVEDGLIVSDIPADNGDPYMGTLTGDSSADVIVGTSGDDIINASSGNNTICSLGGNDAVTSTSGADWIDAGEGNNMVNAGSGTNTMNTGDGNNIIDSTSGTDTITTGSGNDDIDAGSGTNTINAGDGDNIIKSTSGADTITTGSGNDDINAGSGTNIVNSGSGNDSIDGDGGADTFNAGTGYDFCDAGSGTNVLTNCEVTGSTEGIIIVKEADPESSQVFSFTGSLGSFSLTDDGLSANYFSFSPSNGSKTITEDVPDGWSLTSISCTDPSGGTTVNLDEAEAVIDFDNNEGIVCIFTNEKDPEGKISGYKWNDLDGDGVRDQGENPEPGISDWTINLSGEGDQSTTTNEDGYYEFKNLSDGEYTVCESIPDVIDEWTQTWPTKESGTGCEGSWGYNITISDENSSENNNFGNVQYSSITIEKVTDPEDTNPDNGAGGFEFTVTGENNSVVESRSSVTYENLVAGTYDVQEIVPVGWILDSVSCEYSGSSSISIENGEAVSLVAGDDVACTFSNIKLGSITVLKASQPDGTFEFNLIGETDDGDVEETQSITTKDGDGETTLNNLYPGYYDIRETVLDGWKEPTIECLLNGEEIVDNTDFELPAGGDVTCTFNNTEYGVISGTKFQDNDADGVWDDGEDGLENWNITLTKVDDDEGGDFPVPFTDATSGDGNYVFSDLEPGTYQICEEMQDDWVQSMPSSGESCGENGWGYEVTLSAGETLSGQDFGNYQNGFISGYKFEDLNGDGNWDNRNEDEEDNELGLSGWTINLYASGSEEVLATDVTDEDGNYSFSDLKPGDYNVREVVQGGWIQKMPVDADGYFMTVSSGETEESSNFGNFKKPTVTVFKYNDLNGDGELQDEGENPEPTIENWPMFLSRDLPRGEGEQVPIEIIAMSLTGVNGAAVFSLDSIGNYKVFEADRSGREMTWPNPIDSFFDIEYKIDTNGNQVNVDSFFDIFIELSGQNLNSDNQRNPLRFLNYLIPTTSPTPAPPPTPDNSGGGGGCYGCEPYMPPTPSPTSQPTPTPEVAGAITGETPTPTPAPTGLGQATPTPSNSVNGVSDDNSSGNGSSSTPTPTPPPVGGSTLTPSPTLETLSENDNGSLYASLFNLVSSVGWMGSSIIALIISLLVYFGLVKFR